MTEVGDGGESWGGATASWPAEASAESCNESRMCRHQLQKGQIFISLGAKQPPPEGRWGAFRLKGAKKGQEAVNKLASA